MNKSLICSVATAAVALSLNACSDDPTTVAPSAVPFTPGVTPSAVPSTPGVIPSAVPSTPAVTPPAVPVTPVVTPPAEPVAPVTPPAPAEPVVSPECASFDILTNLTGNGCNNCHTAATAGPFGNVVIVEQGDRAATLQLLSSAAVAGCAAAGNYVVPGNADASVLVDVLRGTAALCPLHSLMSTFAGMYRTADPNNLKCLEEWITNGAM